MVSLDQLFIYAASLILGLFAGAILAWPTGIMLSYLFTDAGVLHDIAYYGSWAWILALMSIKFILYGRRHLIYLQHQPSPSSEDAVVAEDGDWYEVLQHYDRAFKPWQRRMTWLAWAPALLLTLAAFGMWLFA